MIIPKPKTHLYLRLSISVGIVGILFKVMHWPYGWLLLATGMLGIAIFYGIRFYHKQPKKLLDYAKLFLLLAFLLHYTFRVFHLPYGYLFTTIFQIAFVLFLIFYAKVVLFPSEIDVAKLGAVATRNKSVRKGLLYLLYGIAGIGIIIGAQFKILHWQFGFITGNVMLMVGLLATAVSVLIGSTDRKA